MAYLIENPSYGRIGVDLEGPVRYGTFEFDSCMIITDSLNVVSVDC